MTAGKSHSEPRRRRFWQRRSLWVIAALLAVAVWLGTGFHTIAANERGVVTRFGRFHAKVQPGIRYALPWPIDRVYTPKTTEVKRIEVGYTMLGQLWSEPRRSDWLTGDENILKLMMVVQYRIRDPIDYLFKADQPHWLVERAVDSAIDLKVAALPVDEVLTTAKAALEVDVIETAQGLLDDYGAGISLLGGNLQAVSPPAMGRVLDAFKDVASAKKDSERRVDEASEYESQVIPQAKGQAQEFISQAQAYAAERVNRAEGDAHRFTSVLKEYRRAKEITRTRLFVDSMEHVLSQMKVVIFERSGPNDPSSLRIIEERR